jgi:hypothetical protein
MGEFYLGMLPPIDNWQDYQTDFRLNTNDLAQALQNRWADIVVVLNNPQTHFLLEWDIGNFPGYILLTGHIQSDLQTLVLSPGPKQIFVDFILWYRAYITSNQRLFLYHSSFGSHYVEITPQTPEVDMALFTEWWSE